MVWDTRVRRLGWVCFALMWVALGFVIYSAVTDREMAPFGTPLRLFFVLLALFFVFLFGSFAVGKFEKEHIRRTGMPAKATIVSVWDTGTRLNDQPLVRIELDVQPPYDSRFTTTVEYVMSYSDLQHLQPGGRVPVYYIEGTTDVALADL